MKKIRNIKEFTKADALAAIGLAMKPSAGRWLAGTLSVWGLGVIVGAAAALLLTPRTGREMRDELSEKVKTFRDRTAARAASAVEASIT
jgi:gas vesicle protein